MVVAILSFSEEELQQALGKFVWPIDSCESLKQKGITKLDPGFLFTLLMNHVTIEPGKAFLMDAGQVHAYIKGNCIEVMANSDNVVRCGFTQKFKDAATMKEVN